MLRKNPFVNGEYYHIYNRGIDKRIIFKSKKDYERFVMLLYIANSKEFLRLDNISRGNKKFPEFLASERGKPLVSIGAWCLMPNHFHLLVRQESTHGITNFMRKIGTGYSMFFNIKYKRSGALFGGPFKSKLIKENDDYMKHLLGYIHINPLEIGFHDWKEQIKNSPKDMKKFLDSYPYSSYLDYLQGNRTQNNILNIENFPDYFQDAKLFENFIASYFTESIP